MKRKNMDMISNNYKRTKQVKTMSDTYYIPFKPSKGGLLLLSTNFCDVLPQKERHHAIAILNENDELPVIIDPRERTLWGLDKFFSDFMQENTHSLEITIKNKNPFKFTIKGSKNHPEPVKPITADIDQRPDQGIYLGQEKIYQFDGWIAKNYLMTLDTSDLNTHVFICGVTGSGKTVLGKIFLEEAALKGIPCIAIDLKGDISSLALIFSGAEEPAELAPFVRTKENESFEIKYAQLANEQKRNLGSFGITAKDVFQYQNQASINIFTPKSNSGFRLAFSAFLKPPKELEKMQKEDIDAYQEAIDFTSENFVNRLQLPKSLKNKAKGYIYEIIKYYWDLKQSMEGAEGIQMILNEFLQPELPISRIGGMDIAEWINDKERRQISGAINELLIGAGRLWFKGLPFDLNFLTDKNEFNGKTPITIINIKHLGFSEQAFIVGHIAFMINFWMRESETDDTKLLFYIDEIGGGGSKEALFPSVAIPPSKPALNRLIRQGRSFGISCLLATQSPNDIDFKALSNCRTWIVGTLRTEREQKKIREGITTSDIVADTTLDKIADLDTGHFIITAPSFAPHKKWQIFHERWLMHYHIGLLDKDIRQIVEKYEKSAKDRIASAEEFLKNNNIPQAISLLTSVIRDFRLSKHRSQAFLQLGKLYYGQDQVSLA
ncbi:MAG: DUF853 family protein, partial [Candidatus Lokiarchaeota archaeon]|nr:DUF853 family protein [Candidatus Lokiarchaeota archaeon]